MARTASNHSDILRIQPKSGGVHEPSPLGQQFVVPASKESESAKKTCRPKEASRPNEQIARRVTADMEKIPAGGRGKTMQLLLDRSSQNEQQLGAVFAPNSMTPPGSGKDTPLSDEDKKAKEKFLMFTRVLMKYLEQRDVAMHAKARLQIRECYEKRGMGDPQFQSLNFTTSLKARLRSTVGELYWRKANVYLNHFLLQKKERNANKAGASKKKSGSAKVAAPGTKKKLARNANATTGKYQRVRQTEKDTVRRVATSEMSLQPLSWRVAPRWNQSDVNGGGAVKVQRCNRSSPSFETGEVTALKAELAQEKGKVASLKAELELERGKLTFLVAELARESEKATTLTGIEQERDAALAFMATVTEEKKDLEEELTEANELAVQQLLVTDRWHGKFDELAALSASGQVDEAAIAAIRYR